MLHLLGVIGTQEIIIIAALLFFIVAVPVIAYQQGKKKGRLEGRLEEIDRNKN